MGAIPVSSLTLRRLSVPVRHTYAVVVVVYADASNASDLRCCQWRQNLFVDMKTRPFTRLEDGDIPVSPQAPVL